MLVHRYSQMYLFDADHIMSLPVVSFWTRCSMVPVSASLSHPYVGFPDHAHVDHIGIEQMLREVFMHMYALATGLLPMPVVDCSR